MHSVSFWRKPGSVGAAKRGTPPARVVAIWAGLKPALTFRASLSKAKGRGNGVGCFSLDFRVRGNDSWFLSLELEYYRKAMVRDDDCSEQIWNE